MAIRIRIPDKIRVSVSFSFHRRGPWKGPIVVSTHPADQEAAAWLADGDERVLPRGYPSYEILVRLTIAGRRRHHVWTLPEYTKLIVQRRGASLYFPTLVSTRGK